jgi:hypothetical protein
MAKADQTPSTRDFDFPRPLLGAVRWVTSQGFALAKAWEAFEQALIWDRIHAFDPRRAHFEGLVPYLQEFSQAGTLPADTDVVRDRGRIRGSTWRQWLADGSLDRETGTIVRLFEGRHPHVEVFEPVLEGADVRSVYSILSARREPGQQPPAAALTPETAAPTLSIAATDLVAGSPTSQAPNRVEVPAVDPPTALVPATENATVEPFRSGFPGRPSSKEVILVEFERRITDREVIPRQGDLSTEAKYLAQWWTTAKPDGAPAPKAGSIGNAIRERWNSLINKT